MKLVVLCLLLLAPRAFADPVPVEVTVKVVEMPKQVILCGYIAFKAVVRFEVISVDQGSFAPKELLGVYLCPELLKPGTQLRLRLVKPAKGSYQDDFKARPGTRWEVRHPDPTALRLTAKLVELPKKIVACGRIAYRAVVRYEVISIDAGAYDSKEIFVVELCPEHRKLGETRTLKLRPVTSNDAFVDDFKSTPGFRAVAVE
jgi:hypothetical protein